MLDRQILYQRINDRVDRMLKQGLIDEVKRIGEQYGYDSVAMTGHAYQQIGKYLQGEWSLEKAIEETKKATRNYAKRQLTWWKKYGDVKWVSGTQSAFDLIQQFLQK
jgi:tRNA dimethylallyltransferase